MNVIILGGGNSVRKMDVDVSGLKNLGYTIGVNDSAVHANVDCCVSMDRLWMEDRLPIIRERNLEACMRECAFSKMRNKVEHWLGLSLFRNSNISTEMSDEPGVLNGTNSGMCAINLAYKLRPKRLFLFGFDMCRVDKDPYWYPMYQWTKGRPGTTDGKYIAWSNQFGSIDYQFRQIGCSIINVSPWSAIDNFKKINYKEFLKVIDAS